MRIWTLPRRFILELDAPALELVITIDQAGAVSATWVDSQTGAELARVPVVLA